MEYGGVQWIRRRDLELLLESSGLRFSEEWPAEDAAALPGLSSSPAVLFTRTDGAPYPRPRPEPARPPLLAVHPPPRPGPLLARPSLLVINPRRCEDEKIVKEKKEINEIPPVVKVKKEDVWIKHYYSSHLVEEVKEVPVRSKIIPAKSHLVLNPGRCGDEKCAVSSDSSSTKKIVEEKRRINEVPPVAKQVKGKDIWIKHYCSSHKILLVGEGDFSFSACLSKAFGSANNMIATSLDSIDFLKNSYANAMSNISDLRGRGCTVIHGVNATEIVNHYFLNGSKFDRIIFNFPLAGFFKDESREDQIEYNQNLVKLFMKNATKMIKVDGEIHVTHKSNGFFLEWKLAKLAWNNGLQLLEEVHFKLSNYPGYNTKYGFGGHQNFDCNPSKTYKFVLQ
ncbi:hypothetical protein IFM89_005504 [Coptis chinensis]|uniref:25S rRNA (uridine-N(3))-methyltransferase BMT5-like domain-containing protein n=1 Tax=Coptis chinensis TaxID=261450 RepID=A0A835GXM6_9MAGN|nr:hypothetical protein IFM89_005504 [Coptis chinensis]